MNIILILSLLALAALLAVANVPIIKNLPTIVWGTVGDLNAPLSGAIAESITYKPKNPTGIGEIEDGNGAAIADVLLDDGFDATITCIYDSAKTWPVTGSAITLNKPTSQGSGGITSYATCYLLGDPEISKTRKKEATITLMIRYRPGITP